MKIILSRKGFDSSNGGIPSPIFPDGSVLSFPIPASISPTRFSDIQFKEYNPAKVVGDLSNNKILPNKFIHLDPDLDKATMAREDNWRGAFGSGKSAQTHLENNNVGIGDIFLFFGWFKAVEERNKKWVFKVNSPNLHVIFGWLEVDEVLKIHQNTHSVLSNYSWLEKHPHITSINHPKNTIYLGKDKISFNHNKNGYGVFENIRDIQILTDTNQKNRSLWKLPDCFYPNNGKPPLTYHKDPNRWTLNHNSFTLLQSAAIGQEFVLDLEYYQDVRVWLSELLS